MGRCGAPCTGAQSVDEYAAIAAVFRAAVDHDPAALVAPLLARVDRLAAEERYEDAADAPRPGRRPGAGGAAPPAAGVAGRRARARASPGPDGAGGWHLSVVRRGRLVAAGGAPQATSVRSHARRAAR